MAADIYPEKNITNILFKYDEPDAPPHVRQRSPSVLAAEYGSFAIKDKIKGLFPTVFETEQNGRIKVDIQIGPQRIGKCYFWAQRVQKAGDEEQPFIGPVINEQDTKAAQERILKYLLDNELISSEQNTYLKNKLNDLIECKAARKKAQELKAEYEKKYGETPYEGSPAAKATNKNTRQ